MHFSQLSEIPSIKIFQQVDDSEIVHLLTDSRKLILSKSSLFVAISGVRHDAHHYIQQAYASGLRMFIVEDLSKINPVAMPEANIALAVSGIDALQNIAAYHRSHFTLDVLAITGSNAKTTIKEYLAQILDSEFNIIKSPKSYNSQVGVPLSVWQVDDNHDLGIFEAGISTVGEMEKLERVIKPTHGIFTNIGTAHDEGFENISQKVDEKLLLFKNVQLLIYRQDHDHIHQAVLKAHIPSLTWGINNAGADINFEQSDHRYFSGTYHGQKITIELPFADPASVENLLHCAVYMIYLGYTPAFVNHGLKKIKNIAMRLELKQGINNCYLIDDTYNNDLAGLKIALDFLEQQKMREKKAVVISDMIQAAKQSEKVYEELGNLLQMHKIHAIYAIGKSLSTYSELLPSTTKYFETTEAFLQNVDVAEFHDEIILIKGARSFGFEKIVDKFQFKTHGTVLEINLEAITHNLNYYRSKLMSGTRVMAMVKAFAYGSGSFEVAQLLQYHKVDYLGVAYTDEAVSLRQNGITMPIMVMNAPKENFDTVIQYQLEPEIYSLKILKELVDFTKERKVKLVKIHLDIDTGMRRLGFELFELKEIVDILLNNPQIDVASIFSHLAGADDELHDDFSNVQIDTFKKFANEFEQRYGRPVIKHICNSAGIVGYPSAHMDMVRLGVGLYGVEATSKEQQKIRAVSTLKSVISQIKEVAAGETVGYGRMGKAEKAKTIATINIGYADGYSRAFSRGVGHVIINGNKAPIIGNVCMDMCMIDITGIKANVGDQVVLFGEELSIIDLANAIGTIPYEILTNVSERVKRVFFVE